MRKSLPTNTIEQKIITLLVVECANVESGMLYNLVVIKTLVIQIKEPERIILSPAGHLNNFQLLNGIGGTGDIQAQMIMLETGGIINIVL